MSIALVLRISSDVKEADQLIASNPVVQQIFVVHSEKHVFHNNANIIVVPELYPKDVTADWLVEVPPYCALSAGTMDTINCTIERMTLNETHFAISTKIVPDSNSYQGPWWGFLTIALMIEMFWNIWFQWGKLYSYHHIRGTAMMRKGPHKFFPPNSSGWITNWHAKRSISTKTAIMRPPTPNLLLHETLNLKIGWWLFIYIPFYFYGLFNIVTMIQYSSIFLVGIVYWSWLYILLGMVHIVVMRQSWLSILLMPFYFVAFPIYLIVQ
jgi:hypothetical protein